MPLEPAIFSVVKVPLSSTKLSTPLLSEDLVAVGDGAGGARGGVRDASLSIIFPASTGKLLAR
jgi:hypothetical protein